MSEPETAAPAAAAKATKSGPSPLALLLPALLAGGAAFGGAKFSAAHASAAAPAEVATHHKEEKAPGPTMSLEPFILTTSDAAKKAHAMRVTIAVEFAETVKEEALKNFVPRIRDAALSYLRTVPYEDAIDATKSQKLRDELLEKFQKAGAFDAERVLVTDLVVQ